MARFLQVADVGAEKQDISHIYFEHDFNGEERVVVDDTSEHKDYERSINKKQIYLYSIDKFEGACFSIYFFDDAVVAELEESDVGEYCG